MAAARRRQPISIMAPSTGSNRSRRRRRRRHRRHLEAGSRQSPPLQNSHTSAQGLSRDVFRERPTPGRWKRRDRKVTEQPPGEEKSQDPTKSTTALLFTGGICNVFYRLYQVSDAFDTSFSNILLSSRHYCTYSVKFQRASAAQQFALLLLLLDDDVTK